MVELSFLMSAELNTEENPDKGERLVLHTLKEGKAARVNSRFIPSAP